MILLEFLNSIYAVSLYMSGFVLMKEFSLFLIPLANAELAACGCASAIVEKMVNLLSRSIAETFTYL